MYRLVQDKLSLTKSNLQGMVILVFPSYKNNKKYFDTEYLRSVVFI